MTTQPWDLNVQRVPYQHLPSAMAIVATEVVVNGYARG